MSLTLPCSTLEPCRETHSFCLPPPRHHILLLLYSDCGHALIWDKRTGAAVRALRGDRRIVNCVESHPHDPVLATSGIDYSIKLWSPCAPPSCGAERRWAGHPSCLPDEAGDGSSLAEPLASDVNSLASVLERNAATLGGGGGGGDRGGSAGGQEGAFAAVMQGMQFRLLRALVAHREDAVDIFGREAGVEGGEWRGGAGNGEEDGEEGGDDSIGSSLDE